MPTSTANNAEDRPSDARHRVLIIGGGVAGLEALLGLHTLAEDFVDLTLVSPDPEFLYKPLLVEEPFALGPAERHELSPLAGEIGARLIPSALERIDSDRRTVELDDGSQIGYDSLVVCMGGSLRPAFQSAITFPSTGGPLRIDTLLRGGEENTRIAFVVPPGVSWALPIYELALMTERHARMSDRRVECTIVTPESAPLIIFGTVVSDSVSQLLAARGIELETGAYLREFDPEVLTLCPANDELDADSVVALPLIAGPHIPGLPGDDAGFLPIDENCRVGGVDDVYAAGDCTNFPIKQGGWELSKPTQPRSTLHGAQARPSSRSPFIRC